MAPPNLSGRVALVTGASRGIGRGVALQLGEAGAVVYITGRNRNGDLDRTRQEVKDRGAEDAVAVQTDHAVDSDVEALFARIKRERQGKLDIVVNNAYAGVSALMGAEGSKFYETPPELWDDINNVGLRNHYLCTVYASRMMVPRKTGLIVNISSCGGISYLFNVAYGVGKEACDRMAADCAHELKEQGVTMVSLWPGPVATEAIKEHLADCETVEFAGRAVVHLAADAGVHAKTGRVLLAGDLAYEYGFTDLDGRVWDLRNLKYVLYAYGYKYTAMFVPGFVRIPLTLLHYIGMKF